MTVLFYDIEIFHTYDEAYQERMYTGWLDKSVRMSADVSCISHFGYAVDDEPVQCLDLTMDPKYDAKAPAKSEKWLLSQIVRFFNTSSHLVAHFGDRFDRRYLNAKFMQHKLAPIPPPNLLKQTDTCLLARRHLKLSSNRLDSIAKFFGLQRKKDKNWPEDWIGMTKGLLAAFKRNGVYCKGDVETLREVYQKLRPFVQGQPTQMAVNGISGCPECAAKTVNKYGFAYKGNKKYQRYICRACGYLFRGGVRL
jgi:hypothetical protein